MSRPITKPQAYWLRNYVHGWTIDDVNRMPAPVRRLIKRGLIAKNGLTHGGVPIYKITQAGKNALP